MVSSRLDRIIEPLRIFFGRRSGPPFAEKRSLKSPRLPGMNRRLQKELRVQAGQPRPLPWLMIWSPSRSSRLHLLRSTGFLSL